VTRFTEHLDKETSPIWSPGGERIVFSKRPGVSFALYEMSASGAGEATEILETGLNNSATDWHPAGNAILYRSPDPETGWDIWALPLATDAVPFPVVQSSFDERDGQFSPDGNWVAYQANDSGRFEVYVRPFPGPGSTSTISTNGGARSDGGPKVANSTMSISRVSCWPFPFDSITELKRSKPTLPFHYLKPGSAAQCRASSTRGIWFQIMVGGS
jgi:Tol biopolymer transport system component